MREIMDIALQPEVGRSARPSTQEVRGLMELEFEAAQREKQPAALMRVHVESFERLAPAPERRTLVLSTVLDELRAMPRGGDILACRDGDDLVVLLPRTPPESAETIARQSIERARKLTLPGAKAPQRASLCIGLAHAQSDLDLYFDTLLQVAEEGLAVASGSGGETVVHTQLYALFQRQIERVRGPRPPPSAAPEKRADHAAERKPAAPTNSVAAPAPLESPAPLAAALVEAPTETITPDPVFEARIKHAFSSEARTASNADFESRVLQMSRAWAEDALAKALKRVDERHRSEIDLYERRIAKLTQALNETEVELCRVAQLKSIDPGVASAYRSVQGLETSESLYATKISLLAKILQANLELRAQLGGASPAT